MKKKISTLDFVRVIFRSFFIQAVWNYQSMLSIGFCYAIIPIGKKLFKDKQERKEFLKRHLNFFNAHPYFSTFAIGAAAKIEEEILESNQRDYSKLVQLKNAMIGPLGAIGDQLVWAIVKPASMLAGVVGVLILREYSDKIIFLIVMGLVYNIPHIYIRYFGLVSGYEMGFKIYKILNLDRFLVIKKLYSWLGAIGIGIFTGFVLLKSNSEGLINSIVFGISMIGAYYIHRFQLSVYVNLAILTLTGLILSWILVGI